MSRLQKTLLFIIFSIPIYCISQDKNTFSFKVRNPASEVIVSFYNDDTTFYTDHNNRFNVKVTGKNKLGPVELKGGSLKKLNNSFIATVNEGIEALLIVYVYKPNGKVDLGTSIKVPIVHLKNPIPYISDVKPDSIIYHKELLTTNRIHARMDRFGKTSYLPIISFDIIVPTGDNVDTLSSHTSNFTPAMRRYLQKLKPGVPLYFTNIMCRMPAGEIRKLDDVTFFVDVTLPPWMNGNKEE